MIPKDQSMINVWYIKKTTYLPSKAATTTLRTAKLKQYSNYKTDKYKDKDERDNGALAIEMDKLLYIGKLQYGTKYHLKDTTNYHQWSIGKYWECLAWTIAI